MFGLFSSSRSPSPTMIKEANEHMQQMHIRMQDLEQRVREQRELLERREREHENYYAHLQRIKEQELAQLRTDLKKLDQRCLTYEKALKEKDYHIAYLLHRCSFADEAASYVPLLENLTQCLKSLFMMQQQQSKQAKTTILQSEANNTASSSSNGSSSTESFSKAADNTVKSAEGPDAVQKASI